jgi:hypothetical protein
LRPEGVFGEREIVNERADEPPAPPAPPATATVSEEAAP